MPSPAPSAPDPQASLRAPAKINLGLHVLRRRADGYHDIDTVLIAIGWEDELRYEPDGAFSFSCSDPTLPSDERNLCVRAAQSLAAYTGAAAWGRLRLEKHIPHGAGLGGGSSDAAATLRLLVHAWKLDIPHEELLRLASRLGSDVPFFLKAEPVLATGRGERLHPLEGYHLPYAIAVVVPPVHVATAAAYRLIRPQSRPRVDLEAVVRSNDLERWRRELVNDFEEPLMRRSPPIAQARAFLEAAGAAYVALSGSGSSVFGLFDDVAAARAAADEAAHQGARAWAGRARTERPGRP